jgi:hypothetical protein
MADESFRLETAPSTIAIGDSVMVTVVAPSPQSGSPYSYYLMIWEAQSVGGTQSVGSFSALPGQTETAVLMPPFATLFENSPNKAQFAVLWNTTDVPPGTYELTATIYGLATNISVAGVPPLATAVTNYLADSSSSLGSYTATVKVNEYPGQQVTVQMRRAFEDPTPDQALWTAIRKSTNALSFNNYSNFMDVVLCGVEASSINFDPAILARAQRVRARVDRRLRLPFPDTDAYRQLKVATEVFVMLNCGISIDHPGFTSLTQEQLDDESRRYYRAVGPNDIETAWKELISVGKNLAPDVPGIGTLPYLAIIRRKLSDVAIFNPEDKSPLLEEAATSCMGILMEKLTHPCLLELIWSYWHEEGMLAQTMNAITWRFQNRRGLGDRDPLAMLEIDPLRPLSNFIWGYIQDEQHRLTVPRRAYEYDHQYGFNLVGKAVPPVRGADTRSRFIEAFHNLLFLCSIFYKEDDDTTVVADGFPVLNGLKEVHLLLTQGAHNQYGDLPWTARQEMLMQEWLLARPEFREYLPSRVMVDYPEPWMDRVEAMKTLQGWSNTSIMHFRDLGVFGEQILLGIRFGAWPKLIEPQFAANWARYWRAEIQGYIHAYRAVTGMDLTERADATPPSVLLLQRLQGLTYDRAALSQGRDRLQLSQARTATRALPRPR